MINRIRVGLLFFLVVFYFSYGLNVRSDCELPKYKGPCNGKYHSYYFDIKSRDCMPFVWSGCGGNGNRFYSLDECQFACSYYMNLN